MDRSARVAAVVAEAQAVLSSALEREWATLSTGDLGTMETRLQQVFRLVGGAVLGGLAGQRLADLAGQPPVCPQCGGAVRYVAGKRRREVVGLVGDVVLRRPYYHCAACQAGMAPLDAAWGLGDGSLSPGLARVACRDGIEATFGAGVDLVWESLGVRLDDEAARGITEAMGRLVEADQQDRGQWALPAAQPAPPLLVVELDGVMVHAQTAWMEMKVGRVAPLGPKLVVDQESGDTHLALGPSSYCAGLEPASAFWPRLTREAWRAGLGRGVRTVVVLGDGADWLWRQARCQLRHAGVEVVEIVDFYHVSEHLATVAAAVFGANKVRASDWLDRVCHLLRHEGARPVRRALAKLRPPTADAAEVVRKARGYVRTHAARMDYPAFRARQFPIGSGAIEGSAKNLIQARQTQAGMRWSVAGAQQVASLRALHRSGRWTAFWQTQPQRRLRLLPRPTPPAIPAPPATDATAPVALDHRPPAHDPAAAAVPPPLTALPAPRHTRIQTAGKPWAKGKDHWRRTPLSRTPPVPQHCSA
jgi:hypothetical protein